MLLITEIARWVCLATLMNMANLVSRISKFTKFHFLEGELLAWVICLDLFCLLCGRTILVLQMVNIASWDQNVWQMQKKTLRSGFNLDIKSERVND